MKHLIVKISKAVVPTLFIFFLFSNVVSAHVTVIPKKSTTGAWETYTLKVPVEKDVPTTKVTVKAPEGLEVMSYQPVPGWTYTAEKDANGKVKSFTFETAGEGILPGQFQQFTFVAKNPENETKIAWDAFQYYKDGSIVEWTGDEGTDKPHSITEIVTGVEDNNQHDAATTENKVDTANVDSKDSNSLPLILSIISVLLSIGAVLLGLRKK